MQLYVCLYSVIVPWTVKHSDYVCHVFKLTSTRQKLVHNIVSCLHIEMMVLQHYNNF